MKIRKGTKKDFNEIVKLFIEGFSEKPYLEKWTQKSAGKRLKKFFNKDYIIYVAESDGGIEGFIIISTYLWYTGNEGFIDEFIVSKKMHGKGIGTILLKKAEKYLRKKGVKEIALYTHRKAKAARFYEKRGYNPGHMIVYTKKVK